jgi:hypothetical protein
VPLAHMKRFIINTLTFKTLRIPVNKTVVRAKIALSVKHHDGMLEYNVAIVQVHAR